MNILEKDNRMFLMFTATPSSFQGLLLAQQLGITPGGLRGQYGLIKPEPAACTTSFFSFSFSYFFGGLVGEFTFGSTSWYSLGEHVCCVIESGIAVQSKWE